VPEGTSSDKEYLIVPSAWERLIVERPLLVMAGTFIGAILLTIIFAANPASLSNGGFEARWHPINMKADAFRTLGASSGNSDRGAYFYFEHAGNILNQQSLVEQCELETSFVNADMYRKVCNRVDEHHDDDGDDDRRRGLSERAAKLLPHAPGVQRRMEDDSWREDSRPCAPVVGSLITYLFEFSDPTCNGAVINTAQDLIAMSQHINCTFKHQSHCVIRPNWQEIVQWFADPEAVVPALPAEAVGGLQYGRQIMFGNEFTKQSPQSSYVRTQFPVDWFEEFVLQVVNKGGKCDMSRCDLGSVTAYYNADETFDRQMWSDMQLVFVSIVVVFLYIWFNTQSFFLAAAGIFEVFISFPMAFFVWSTVLQFEHFGILMMMTLFIILGIGE
jgi:hypothetical protein